MKEEALGLMRESGLHEGGSRGISRERQAQSWMWNQVQV
jgi:hypothetical protein